MSPEPSGKPDAWKLARPVWGWGRGETPRPTPQLLESFLQTHGLAFTRSSEGKWDYDPERVEYRPPNKPLAFATNHAGEIVVPVSRLARLIQAMSKIRQRRKAVTPTHCQRAIAMLARELKNALPPHVPPLEPFEIVHTHSRSRPRGE